MSQSLQRDEPLWVNVVDFVLTKAKKREVMQAFEYVLMSGEIISIQGFENPQT